MFSAIWGICFSLKANPNGTKNIAFWHTFGTGGSPARYQFVKSRSSPQNVLAQLAQHYQTRERLGFMPRLVHRRPRDPTSKLAPGNPRFLAFLGLQYVGSCLYIPTFRKDTTMPDHLVAEIVKLVKKAGILGSRDLRATGFLDCILAWLLSKARSRVLVAVFISHAERSQPNITVWHRPRSECPRV